MLEDIDALGKAGEIAKVKPGYFRNYLQPLKKALLANEKNLRQLEHHRKTIQAKMDKLKKEAEAMKSSLEGVTVVIAKQAGEGDKLFGSVTAMEIEKALHEKGFTIDKKKIEIEEPIKTLGTFTVSVKCMRDIKAEIKVEVVKE